MDRAKLKAIAKEAAIWVPTLFLVYVFTTQGASKFSDTSGWARAFRYWGYPDWFLWTIGFAELLAAALLLWRRTAALGAAIIVIVMLGGIGTHVAAGDRFWFRSETTPIVLATIVILARHSRSIVSSPRARPTT
jgi:uncharacterized membrane protein YphA (DoxX/SURF4 family)